MRILQFTAENFKKIRIVEITPKGHMTTITGRNGQGKTSVLDALWALFAGKKAIPEKPVRRGAEKSKLKAIIGDDAGKPILIAARTISADRTTTLTIEAAPGAQRPAGTPQAVLDTLIGEMSFDPIAFIHMEARHQVEVLRGLVKVDVDIDALNLASATDYKNRTGLNTEAARLKAEAESVNYSPGLPAEKVDCNAIRERISQANLQNVNASKIFQAKQVLGGKVGVAQHTVDQNAQLIADATEKVERLERELESAKGMLAAAHQVHPQLLTDLATAKQLHEEAPAGDILDLAPLNAELNEAELTNREIDKRTRRADLDGRQKDVERAAATLTRAMEAREEQKRTALATAAMPVDGLTFTEEGVFYKMIPLEQLGEAEQIRVGVALAMASNPKLRAVPIARGESLDDVSLAMIEKMAEENDFQIFMARVDSSGKVGIVLSDGMVESVNE